MAIAVDLNNGPLKASLSLFIIGLGAICLRAQILIRLIIVVDYISREEESRIAEHKVVFHSWTFSFN